MQQDLPADSTAATTSDYNDFYFSGPTAPYSWGGTDYSSIATKQEATSVDPQDMLETEDPRTISTSSLEYSVVPAILLSGSTGIGAANPNAPEALSTDLYGINPYHDCGAVVFTQNIANAAVIPVGADGKINISNSMMSKTGHADVIVDVVGYYSADGRSAYVSTSPYRYPDTRSRHGRAARC